MMRRLRLALLSLLMILLFLEIWLGFPTELESVAKEESLLDRPLENNAQSDKHMEGVHFVESKAGSRDWELFAASADGSEQSGEWTLKAVRVLFYSGNSVEYTLVGQTGRIDTLTKDLKITGDVRITSKNGYHFQTQTAHYTARTRLLESDSIVKMTAPVDAPGSVEKPLVLHGDQLRLTVGEEKMLIHGHVHAEKILADSRHFGLSSDEVEASGHERNLHFRGHVESSVDALRMQSDEAAVQYDPRSSILQTISILGGVRMSDTNRYATANNIEFRPAENQFVLRGNPRVVQNNDEITGEEIVFLDGGRKVKVQKMKAKLERVEE